MAMSLEQRIRQLERRIDGTPGTILQRVLMGEKDAKREGIDTSTARNGVLVVWCLGIGKLAERKTFFYDVTILGVLMQAECVFRAREAWSAKASPVRGTR